MKKKTLKNSKKFYALIKVYSGIPVQVLIFDRLSLAKEKEERMREKMNLDNDETAIFRLIV